MWVYGVCILENLDRFLAINQQLTPLVYINIHKRYFPILSL